MRSSTPAQLNAARQILQETGGRGVDVAMDCAGQAESLDQSVEATRNGGRVVITGIFAEVCVPWQSHITRRKELVMYNVRRSNHESETALELLREHPARFAPIITHTCPIGPDAGRLRDARELFGWRGESGHPAGRIGSHAKTRSRKEYPKIPYPRLASLLRPSM